MFEIELYETTDGKEPVAGFIRSLDTKMRGKLDALLENQPCQKTSYRMAE